MVSQCQILLFPKISEENSVSKAKLIVKEQREAYVLSNADQPKRVVLDVPAESEYAESLVTMFFDYGWI